MTPRAGALVLGIDGGGTQTRAVIAGLQGETLGQGAGGACTLSAMTANVAFASVRDAAQAALAQAGASAEDIGAVCAGVAGYSHTQNRAAFEALLASHFHAARVSVLPDFAIALEGASDGQPGVIVIAGTGSVAYGENGVGKTHRAGGYGYLLDDAGSGYGVGRAALAAVLHASDGTGELTSLTGRVLPALGLASAGEIVPGVYGGGIERVAVAALSRTVADAAGLDNDTVARAILMRAGGALAVLAHGVTSALFPADAPSFPVCPIGGLWSAGPLLRDVFTRSLHRFAPQATVIEPFQSPVQGAVLRALTLLGKEV